MKKDLFTTLLIFYSFCAFGQVPVGQDSIDVMKVQDIVDSLKQPIQEVESNEEKAPPKADTDSTGGATGVKQDSVNTSGSSTAVTDSLEASTPTQTVVEVDSAWFKGGSLILNLNQIGFFNWAQGGENGMSLTFMGDIFSNYDRRKVSWDNGVSAQFGLFTLDNYAAVRKNEDRFSAYSKFGVSVIKKVYASALVDFTTQFAPGYDYYYSDSIPVSKFMSPAFLTAGAGVDWQPNYHFSLFLSPFTGRLTYILDPEIAATGLYGNEPAVYDTAGNIIEPAEQIRREFGALVSLRVNNVRIGDNITETGQVTLFNNYTDPDHEKRKNIDVHIMNSIAIRHHKYFTTSIYVEIIYDEDILLPDYAESNGVVTQVGSSPKAQVKEIIGINFSYFFGDAALK